MDEKEMNAYKNGFLAGLDLKEARLFDLPIEEVLDILAKHVLSKSKREHLFTTNTYLVERLGIVGRW